MSNLQISNTFELYNLLKSNNFVIYGAGEVAARFCKALEKHGIIGNLLSFVTTTGSVIRVNGLPIIGIEQLEINDKTIICVAVHEAVAEEITAKLVEKNFKNYVWIYPYLYELMLGTPICHNVKVPLSKIWNAIQDDYCIAIRYLAIENYYNKNNIGFELYKNFFSFINDSKTSEKRLFHFINLIKSWEEHGYINGNPSSITENYQIVDGTHRITLAIYFNQEYAMCNIHSTNNIAEVQSHLDYFTKENMLNIGVEPNIIALLDGVNQRIKEQYK